MPRFARYCWLLIALLALPLPSLAQTQPRIIMLGADLTPEQRSAIIARFGAAQSDQVQTITADETQAAMQNILPVPAGYTSISSSMLSCGAPGSGLHVTAENITKVSAAMYAGALVTAGVGDADLVVVAPADAPAEGMTALAGVFKGLSQGGCGRGELDGQRRTLAYRQLALTADIAATTGDLTKAADVVLRAQQVLIREHNNPDAAVPIVQGVQNDTGVQLPQPQFDALVLLLATMGQANLDWGTYASGWTLDEVSATEVRVTPQQLGAPSGSGTGGALAPDVAGKQLRGVVASVNPLRINATGVSAEFALRAADLQVTRNGQTTTLATLQPGDTVTITVGDDGVARQVDAVSSRATAGTATGGPASTTTGTSAAKKSGLPMWLLGLLGLLVILVVLFFLYNRRRREQVVVAADYDDDEELLG